MTRRRLVAISLVLTGFLLAAAGLTGCSSTAPNTVSVPDLAGGFHFYIPSTWQQNQTPGLIAVYASEKLPSNPADAASSIKSAPSLLVLTSEVPSTAPVGRELTHLVELRAANRAWRQQKLAAPESIQIGGRSASRVAVTGVDSTGADFKGAFYLIRTNNNEYFMAALSTPDKWDAFSRQLDAIMKTWFWQGKAANAATSTPTPKKK